MVAAELATILAFVLVHCWFTRRSMGITNFGFGDPEILENVERGYGTPPQKLSAVGKVWVIGKQLL